MEAHGETEGTFTGQFEHGGSRGELEIVAKPRPGYDFCDASCCIDINYISLIY